jgi:hypothetical protein
MPQTVILELPEPLYRTAHRVAEATRQSLEVVLQASIAHALPPLDDVPPEEAVELAAMVLLNDATLWREARIALGANEQAKLHDFLDRQGAGELSSDEELLLQSLLDTYGRLMVRKAHAWLLLARRGYQVPIQQNQEE